MTLKNCQNCNRRELFLLQPTCGVRCVYASGDTRRPVMDTLHRRNACDCCTCGAHNTTDDASSAALGEQELERKLACGKKKINQNAARFSAP